MVMNQSLRDLCWPGNRLCSATAALAGAAGLVPRLDVPLPEPDADLDEETADRFLSASGEHLDIRVHRVRLSWATLSASIASCGPAILRLVFDEGDAYLAILGGRGKRLRVLKPDLGVAICKSEVVAAHVAPKLEDRYRGQIECLLEEAEVPARRRARALRHLLGERIGHAPIDTCWTLEMKPGKGVFPLMRQAGLFRRSAAVLSWFVLQYLIGILAWYLIGTGALSGRIDLGWVMPWALLVLFQAFGQVHVGWLQGLLSIELGSLIKRKLLEHTFALEHAVIRRQGMGQLLGKIFDTENIQGFALNGGFIAALAIVELVMAATVIAAGASGPSQLVLFVAWLALMVALSLTYWHRRRGWTNVRLDLTHDLVERMAGHRTRLAQESRAHWHDQEDRTLHSYFDSSRKMDRISLFYSSLALHGWVVVALIGLAPQLVAGASSPGALAVAFGGILLAASAFAHLNLGFSNLAGFLISCEHLKPVFSSPIEATPATSIDTDRGSGQALDARNLSFSFPGRARPVLSSCSLRLESGDRVLLTGPSGGGKSTLAAVLAGLREQDSGVLLFGGLDLAAYGARTWRKRVALAPQFHENLIFSETMAYNLLMGRCWPPKQGDLRLAHQVCLELGLADLLKKMPSGLSQMVGETGWHLSHGERNRIFLARALLQEPEILILDESFAALDPANMNLVFDTVLKRAKTLVVIAHP